MSHHNQVGSGNISGLKASTASLCEGGCKFGPSVRTLSNGPDATASLLITTCREFCQNRICSRIERADLDDATLEQFQKAQASAGSPYVEVDHFDN